MNVFNSWILGFASGFLCGWILFLVLMILRDFHEEEN